MAEAQKQPRSPQKRLYIFIIFAGLLGSIAGLGSFTFAYAKGTSYLTDEPSACANCHVMRDVYTAWSRGSHQNVAVCNDCHTPHTNLIAKYGVKAINGFKHSAAFTLDNFPEPIRISQMNYDVTRESCLYCHSDLTKLINHSGNSEPLDCLQCHARVGHDE